MSKYLVEISYYKFVFDKADTAALFLRLAAEHADSSVTISMRLVREEED